MLSCEICRGIYIYEKSKLFRNGFRNDETFPKQNFNFLMASKLKADFFKQSWI